MGAAVAYYTIFSLAPLLILLIAFASTVFDRSEVVHAVTVHLTRAFGASISDYILSLTTSVSTIHFGVIGAIISAFVLFFAAIGTISEVNADLEELWLTPRPKKARQTTWIKMIRTYFKERAIMFFLIILGALMLVISIAFSLITAGIPWFGVLQNVLTIVLATVLFVAMYRLLPNVVLPYRELIRGALLTSVLFLLGKVGIGLYLAHTSVGSFGAAGSLIAVLVWIFYSAQVFFLAASWMFVYSKHRGFLSNHTS